MSREADRVEFVVGWLRRKSSAFMRGSLGAVNPDHTIKSAEMDALAAFMIEDLFKRVPRWISVEERLPEAGVYVLCWYACESGGKWHSVGRWCAVNGAWDLDIDEGDPFDPHTVTHWMPLPEPPDEGEG